VGVYSPTYEREQAELADQGFDFNLNFYVKCMIGTLTETMTYEQVYDVPEDELKSQWHKLAGGVEGYGGVDKNPIFDYVINVLKNEGHIPTSDYINTRDVLIPFIVYLNKQEKQLSHEEKTQFLRWLYSAMMWSRYSGSSDTTVNTTFRSWRGSLRLTNLCRKFVTIEDELKYRHPTCRGVEKEPDDSIIWYGL